MTSLPFKHAVAAIGLAWLFGAAAPGQAAAKGACHCRPHVTAARATSAHARHRWARRDIPYVSVPRVPRYDPAQVEAEVHEVARYRTPYPYPALFGPF